MRVPGLLSALAVALLALPARAELVSVDLLAPGDGLVTRDTESGLDWLDLGGVTTNLSYDAVVAGAGGWTTSGWRHATHAEVCALFVTHGGVPSCTFTSNFVNLPPPDFVNLQNLLSVTDFSFPPDFRSWVRGFYDDATAPATSVGLAALEASGFGIPPLVLYSSIANDNASLSSTAVANRGHFLVRATPAQIPALPLAGAAALAALLAFAARRMRSS